MIKDRGSALDGFNALYDGTGNADAMVSESVTTKCVIDYELVRLCQSHGWRPSKGRSLGLLAELWPFDMLKRPLIAHANEFVSQIGTQGFKPLSSVYSFKLWGPYTEKVSPTVRYWTPEEGNHLIPKHLQRKAVIVQGYRGDEFNFEKGCAFLIQGTFIKAAKDGHIGDEGVIYI